jgi:hypothetical protein
MSVTISAVQIILRTKELAGSASLFFSNSSQIVLKYKSPGNDQIPAELYQAGGEILLSVIHKFITSIWNKEERPDQWKESITVPIHKTGDKTDCNNYRGISLLSISYKILSNILL